MLERKSLSAEVRTRARFAESGCSESWIYAAFHAWSSDQKAAELRRMPLPDMIGEIEMGVPTLKPAGPATDFYPLPASVIWRSPWQSPFSQLLELDEKMKSVWQEWRMCDGIASRKQ